MDSCYNRAIITWFLMMSAETMHGVARRIYLLPLLGDLRSRQWGVFLGSLIILTIATVCIRWIRPHSQRSLWWIGILWVSLTLSFEILLGLLVGFDIHRIAADYDPRQGGLMLLGMVILFLAPSFAQMIRPTKQTSAEKA
ncbi:MAG: hypothetical protein U0905_23115 [Pirellulales bacterium]